jgi:hypothetical protein
MKTLFNILPFILAISLIIASCDTTEPPIVPPPPVVKDTITVAIESFTHRSISLNIQSTANGPQSAIRALRIFNSTTTTIAEYPILVKDTTIIDDNNRTGLLLDTTYTYFAVRVDSLGQLKDTSNIVTQKTLAPTSHNYTWQEYTIGDWQSALYDVWGTDENNVWAVGSVTINDTVYGVLKWNGIEWLPVKKNGGFLAIYGFSTTDIWAVGGAVWHFNGIVWEEYTYRDPVINNNITYTSIWGTSSSNLYLGNHWGKIIHWDGSKASVVYENPNNIRIWDIFGLSNNFILSTGNSGVSPSFAIRFNGTNWENLEGIDYSTHLFATVYVINPKEYYVGGAAAYGYLGNQWEPIPGNLYRLRGNKTTGELVGVGPGNVMNYYNGKQWYSFRDQINNEFAALYGVFVTEHKIFSVGITTTRAKIYIGSK